jgi:hypothetical protein
VPGAAPTAVSFLVRQRKDRPPHTVENASPALRSPDFAATARSRTDVLPNTVIAGAPKSGTTSLFRWLNDHPDVCGSNVKEPRYLMDDDSFFFEQQSSFRDRGLEGYEEFFDHCEGLSPKVVLEATPSYLYQHTAPDVLSQLDPTPDVIFVLRKPSERAYSHFHYFQDTKARIERRVDFREFVALALREDPRLSELTTGPATKVVANSCYVDYLPIWFDRFPRERLHFFLFEHMTRDPMRFVQDVAASLGLDPTFFDTYEFKRWNSSFQIRSPRIHRMRRLVGRRLPAGARKRLKATTASTYARINVDPRRPERTSDEAQVVAELDEYFEPFNERLAKLTGLDLTAWR